MADEITAAQKAADKTQIDAVAAQQAADEAALNKSPEQIEADKKAQKADDAAAKLQQLTTPVDDPEAAHTAEDAKALVPTGTEQLLAGDHMAQKFGNDPANPKGAPGIPTEGTEGKVMISRSTSDKPGELIKAWVDPLMVGDYERAGWNRG